MAGKQQKVPEGWHPGGEKVAYNELASHQFVSVVLKGDLASLIIIRPPLGTFGGMWRIFWCITHNLSEHSEGMVQMTQEQVEAAFDIVGNVSAENLFSRVGSRLIIPGPGGISIFVTAKIRNQVRDLAFRTLPSEFS